MNNSTSLLKPKTLIPQKFAWSGRSPIKQIFSLPNPLVYYMSKNPVSAKYYSKLIQSCKYFFENNSILVASKVNDKNVICSCETCVVSGFRCECKYCVQINANKIISHFWFTFLTIGKDALFFFPLFFTKIYRCDRLELFYLKIKFNDFKIFAFSLKKIHFQGVQVTDEDGNDVILEDIFGSIPDIEKFSISDEGDSTMVNPKAIKNFSKLENLHHLNYLELMNIREIFDLEKFSIFIASRVHIKFCIYFQEVNDNYSNQLDRFIDTVIVSETVVLRIKGKMKKSSKLWRNAIKERFEKI